jgi:hypothetical protein
LLICARAYSEFSHSPSSDSASDSACAGRPPPELGTMATFASDARARKLETEAEDVASS